MTNGTASKAQVIGWVAIALAVIISTAIAASAWKHVKTRPPERTIEVTGSAKKRIVSDLIEWRGRIETENMDRTAAYRELKDNVAKVLSWLETKGMAQKSIRVSSVYTSEDYDTVYEGVGDERIQKQEFAGYEMRQSVTIRSNDVAKVEQISREVTQLLEQGISITSDAPDYYYTRLGELKIEMLAAASADARERAENIVAKAGKAKLGRLEDADMGVINVNPANSTETSWQGNNDTSSLEKDIITIVHATFELK